MVFSDPDTTCKNLRVEGYKLDDQTVADPTDEKAIKAIDATPATHRGASRISKKTLTPDTYVIYFCCNVGTGAKKTIALKVTI